MPLATLGNLKTHLRITGTAEDAFLTQLLSQVDEVIKNFLGRRIEQATYTEYYSGTGTPYLCLRETPVQSVLNVWVDARGHWDALTTAFDPSTLLTPGEHYALVVDANGQSHSGVLYRIRGVWEQLYRRIPGILQSEVSPGQGNIKVQYIAGYATVPKDLEYAAIQTAAYLRSFRLYGRPVSSESYQDRSISYLHIPHLYAFLQTGDVGRVLARYRRVAI